MGCSQPRYRDGSIYHAIDARTRFWIVLAITMTGILILGLLRRERHGFANIGFESAAIVALYVGAVAVHGYLG